MPLLSSTICFLTAGIAFVLVMGTGDACCERSQLNGAADGMSILKYLVYDSNRSNEDIWFLPNGIGSSKPHRLSLHYTIETLREIKEKKKDLESLGSDLAQEMREVMDAIIADSIDLIRIQLDDENFNPNNSQVLERLYARLNIAKSVEKMNSAFHALNGLLDNFSIIRSGDTDYPKKYGYWKSNVKEYCLCCSATVQSIERRVFDFSVDLINRCCPSQQY